MARTQELEDEVSELQASVSQLSSQLSTVKVNFIIVIISVMITTPSDREAEGTGSCRSSPAGDRGDEGAEQHGESGGDDDSGDKERWR